VPVLQPNNSAPYDIVNTVLNTARLRLNDAIQSLGGDVLTNMQPFTQQAVNTAWRRLQAALADLGFSRSTEEIVLTGLPVVANLDPASQVCLSWTNYFDGTNYFTAPVLPQDLILPLKLWERPSGVNATWGGPITNFLDGLPGGPKAGANFCWEWRNDAIYMPGSLCVVDLRIRYAAYLPDFITAGQTPWYSQPVPIMRSLDAFAYFICSEVAGPRGDLDAATFDTKAEAAVRQLFNREAAQKQRVNIRRIPRSAR
jgi:hypothetical protein